MQGTRWWADGRTRLPFRAAAAALLVAAGSLACTPIGGQRRPAAAEAAGLQQAALPLAAKAPEAARQPSHEPEGFVAPWAPFDGTELPPDNACRPPNRFGMCGWSGQMPTLSLERDGAGRFMRVLYPGRRSPLRDRVWPPPDYGGRSPSRFGWAMQLDSLRATRLYLRIEYRLSENWSHWGAVPPDFTRRAYNAGVKLLAPRVKGERADGTPETPWENNIVMLSWTSDDPREPAGDGWTSGGGRREGMTLEFQMQNYAYGWSGVPRRYVCDRGEWCRLEMLLTLGDSLGHQTAWMNGEEFRSQPFVTPRFLKDGTRLHKVWWSYVWADPTFGGGLNVPWEDQWIDFRSFYASLGP